VALVTGLMFTLLPPPPPPLDNPPHLSGRTLKACGLMWRVEMLGMWRAEVGLFPDLDILCRLSAIGAPVVHSVLVEVDRALIHLPCPSEAILRALEQVLSCDPMPIVVRVDAAPRQSTSRRD
jgi:hypothetical protein